MNMPLRIFRGLQRQQKLARHFSSNRVSLAASQAEPLSSLIPASAWDTHTHITDPAAFPTAKTATYKAHAALLPELRANAARIAVPNVVLVQTSTYGYDNRCLLHYLTRIRDERRAATAANAATVGDARGIVVIDPNPAAAATEGGVTDEQLREWHDLGVRGVRINLKSVGRKLEAQQMNSLLSQYSQRLQAVGGDVSGWSVQVFLDLSDVSSLEAFASECLGSGKQGAAGGIKLVIDHLGSPQQVHKSADDMPGFDALKRLMRSPAVSVKVSGHYRIKGADGQSPSKPEEWEGVVKELLAIRNGDGLLFASDWPHTRFDGWDIEPWTRACAQWAGERRIRDLLFRDNAGKILDAGN